MAKSELSSQKSNLFQRLAGWKYSRYYWLVIVIASTFIATTAELWMTRLGAGVSGDAVHYMLGANNLIAGNGFSRLRANGQLIPITGFPPGFSMVLAGLGLTGLPVFDAGRYLNAILFGVNTLLMGWLVYRSTCSGLIAIVGSWMFMYAKNIFQVHSWIMSEPLFIFLLLASVLLLDLYLRKKSLIFLILAALAIAFATLTRYVGIAMVPAACIALLWFKGGKSAKAWRDSAIVVVASLVPVALWLWHNAQVSGNLVNRQLIYHPISKDLIFTLFNELAYWWFPPSLSLPWKIRWSLLFLFFAAGVGIFLYAYNKQGRGAEENPSSSTPVILGVFVPAYIISLLLSTTFIDAATDVPSVVRYLIPIVAVGIIFTFSTYSLIGSEGRAKVISLSVLVVIGLGMTLLYASKSVPFLLHPGFSFGYTDDRRNWQCEVDTLKAIDPQRMVITNDYEEFYFLADRPAYALTGEYDKYLGKNVEDFEASIQGIQKMIKDGAILALLGDPNEYRPEANVLIGDMGLKVYSDCSKLRLYALPPSN